MRHCALQEVLEIILNEHVEFPDDEWEHISDAAKHLITAMLDGNPDRRLTIRRAVLHPWFVRQD